MQVNTCYQLSTYKPVGSFYPRHFHEWAYEDDDEFEEDEYEDERTELWSDEEDDDF